MNTGYACAPPDCAEIVSLPSVNTDADKAGSWLTTKGLLRVPEITVAFWIIKGLSTAMGESTSDFLVHAIAPALAVVLGFTGLVAALIVQFWQRRYVAWTYWLAVVMVGIFGTMAADVLHVGLHVSYTASTILYAIVLMAIFVIWQRTEHTLSIHSIDTVRREAFYWTTVAATFAMGTALGDFTAYTLRMGYFPSARFCFDDRFATSITETRASLTGGGRDVWVLGCVGSRGNHALSRSIVGSVACETSVQSVVAPHDGCRMPLRAVGNAVVVRALESAVDDGGVAAEVDVGRIGAFGYESPVATVGGDEDTRVVVGAGEANEGVGKSVAGDVGDLDWAAGGESIFGDGSGRFAISVTLPLVNATTTTTTVRVWAAG